jgi:hypothetical protein
MLRALLAATMILTAGLAVRNMLPREREPPLAWSPGQDPGHRPNAGSVGHRTSEREAHAEPAFASRQRGILTAHQRRHRRGACAGHQEGEAFGRRKIDPAAAEQSIQATVQVGGKGIHKIAAEFGVGVGTVQRIKNIGR